MSVSRLLFNRINYYRVGWIIPPEKFADRIEMLKFSNTVSANSASQMAIADYLKNSNYERHLRKIRQILSQNMHLYSQKILECFPEGTKLTTPTGGCLLWIEFPKGIDTLELHQRALKHKISIIPGPVFSSSGKYQNCIRISIAAEWNEGIQNALERIGKLSKLLLKSN